MKKTKTLIIDLLTVVLLAGLVISPSCAKPAEEEVEVPTIGFIGRLAVPYWIICDEGFRAAAADFGFKPIIYEPPQLTVEDQIRVMETWIAMGIDGIVIGPNDPDAVIGVIKQAIDAGIPVVTFDVDAPDSERLLAVGWAESDVGKMLAKGELAVLGLAGISPPGKITYSTGTMVSAKDVGIWESFRDTIEAAGYEAVEPLLDGGDAAIALSLAETAIELYPDLKGMVSYYDYCGPAVGKAVTDAGKIDIIPVHSLGIIGEEVPFLETGAIDALSDQSPYGTIYLSAEIMYKLVQAGRENWDDVLREYHPAYPADKVLNKPLGWITYEEVEVELWPEVGWYKTMAEWKEAYPAVWEIIR